MKSTHSDKLEKFVGADDLAELSRQMRGWYGPPIALVGVPGAVYATGDGDFIGDVRDGHANMWDHAEDLKRRFKRALRVAGQRNRSQLNAGFASLTDLLGEAKFKKQHVPFHAGSFTHTGGTSSSLWAAMNGSASNATPGGRATSNATTGALPSRDAVSGDNLYVTATQYAVSSTTSRCLLFYDRLFDVKKTVSSSAFETVSGVPTRYQSTTKGNEDWAGGNFLFPECVVAIAGISHSWTGCTYADENGNASTLPATGNLATVGAGQVDLSSQNWFATLEAGDVGITALTGMQCSVATITSDVNFVMGHPLGWSPNVLANVLQRYQHFTTAFNLTRVFDGACLAVMIPTSPGGSTTSYSGTLTLVSG